VSFLQNRDQGQFRRKGGGEGKKAAISRFRFNREGEKKEGKEEVEWRFQVQKKIFD